MGVFLYAAIVQNGNIEDIKAGIRRFEKQHSDMNIISEECKFKNNDKGVLVIFNESANGYETLGKALSEEICMPVMLLYIYDSDGWGYFYCKDGAVKDLFSVCPEDASHMGVKFKGKLQNTPPKQYKKSAKFIAKQFHINAKEIINYYRVWTDELTENEDVAYDDDEFTYGDGWQMTDFMRKLGFLFLDGGEETKNTKTVGRQGAQSPQQVAQSTGNFHYTSQTPYVCAFSYEYRRILTKQYGNRLKDIDELMELGQYRQARDELTKNIDALKDICNNDEDRKFLSGLYLLRGNCSRTVGNSWQAGKDLDAAYELESENVYILRQRISTGTSKERIKREINDLNTLMRIDGNHYDDYLVKRAWHYYRLEDLEAARKDLQEAKIRGKSNGDMDFVSLCKRLGV